MEKYSDFKKRVVSIYTSSYTAICLRSGEDEEVKPTKSILVTILWVALVVFLEVNLFQISAKQANV